MRQAAVLNSEYPSTKRAERARGEVVLDYARTIFCVWELRLPNAQKLLSGEERRRRCQCQSLTQEATMKAGDLTKGLMFMIEGWDGSPLTPVDPSERSEGSGSGGVLEKPGRIFVCGPNGPMLGMGILAVRDGQMYALPVTVDVKLVE